jgi:hypothetical protein
MYMKDKILKWQRLTNEITENWIRDYFEIEEDEEIYFDWVANDTGTIFNFADYWFDFNTVLKCYELDITREQLLNWYNFCLDNHSVNISLARFILSPEERKQAEEKHLAELKERVKSAEKTLKEAILKYEK